MEIRVQGVHEQGAGVHKLSLRPLQPRDGSVYRGTERTSEVTRGLHWDQSERDFVVDTYPLAPPHLRRASQVG